MDEEEEEEDVEGEDVVAEVGGFASVAKDRRAEVASERASDRRSGVPNRCTTGSVEAIVCVVIMRDETKKKQKKIKTR